MAEYLSQEIRRLCQQKDKVEVIELNVQTDHVHIILSIPPKYSVSQLMAYLKGKPALKKDPEKDIGVDIYGQEVTV